MFSVGKIVLMAYSPMAAMIIGTNMIMQKDMTSRVRNFINHSILYIEKSRGMSHSSHDFIISLHPLKKSIPSKFYTFFRILKIFFQIFNFVQSFPRKVQIITSKVTVCCCLLVDWSSQIQHLDDTSRAKIEMITNDLN